MSNTAMQQYITDAQRTLSTQFHGDMITRREFITLLTNAIVMLQQLDKVKKTLFYGKPYNLQASSRVVQGERTMSADVYTAVEIDIMHAIIGSATEAGELLETVFARIVENQAFDYVNLYEETGDQLWYQAILLSRIGSSFESTAAINIDKLRNRYPNKFNTDDALNRDLIAERDALVTGYTKVVDSANPDV